MIENGLNSQNGDSTGTLCCAHAFLSLLSNDKERMSKEPINPRNDFKFNQYHGLRHSIFNLTPHYLAVSG